MALLDRNEPRLFYVDGLRNAHAMETQAIQLLTRQAEHLERYPEMEAQLRRHITESETQRTRLEEVLASLDEDHASTKDGVLGLGGNLAAMLHMPAADEVIKNTLANFAFEHFEIAAYISLIAMAEALGHPPGVTAAQASLREEEAMAEWLRANIAPTTTIFLQRIHAGETASH